MVVDQKQNLNIVVSAVLKEHKPQYILYISDINATMNKILQELKVSLLNADHILLDRNWDYDNVLSPYSRMYFIKSGAGKIYHSNGAFDLKPGYCYLIPSFTYSRYKCDNAMEQYYIHFLEEVGKGLSIYNLHNFIYESQATGITEGLFHRLLEINLTAN